MTDPENSVFYDYWKHRDPGLTHTSGSRIEGIGRPRVEPSFLPDVIDEMLKVPDGASLAGMYALEKILGRRVGPSTGTNFIGMLHVAEKMKARGERGSLVTLICDSGERYPDTYYNPEWVAENIGDISKFQSQLSC